MSEQLMLHKIHIYIAEGGNLPYIKNGTPLLDPRYKPKIISTNKVSLSKSFSYGKFAFILSLLSIIFFDFTYWKLP